MKMLKPFFPLAFGEKKEIVALVIDILIHIIVDVLAGLAIGILGDLPLIGWAFALIGGIIDLYIMASLVLTILDYMNILK